MVFTQKGAMTFQRKKIQSCGTYTTCVFPQNTPTKGSFMRKLHLPPKLFLSYSLHYASHWRSGKKVGKLQTLYRGARGLGQLAKPPWRWRHFTKEPTDLTNFGPFPISSLGHWQCHLRPTNTLIIGDPVHRFCIADIVFAGLRSQLEWPGFCVFLAATRAAKTRGRDILSQDVIHLKPRRNVFKRYALLKKDVDSWNGEFWRRLT